MSKFELMHKDVEVAELELDEEGKLTKVLNVRSVEHMPCGTIAGTHVDRLEAAHWWAGRSIPASRSGIKSLLEYLDIFDTKCLILKCMGLSLSDQYWIRPSGSDIQWKDVNFFDNSFSDDVGNLLFGMNIATGELDLSSPDNTSDGVLKKKWCIVDGKRCLIKAGTRPMMQESFNEVIASRIADLLSIEHVEYGLIIDGRDICSICPNMVDKNTELVTAYRASKMMKRDGSSSFYQHYVKICDSMGLDIIPFLDRMIVLDYLMLNTDRHTNNFGIIRDADTLEWLGPAPIFDNGTSLKFDEATPYIMSSGVGSSKPFKTSFEEQLDLVSSFDWIDGELLEMLPTVVENVLTRDNGWIYPERTEALAELMRSRVDRLGFWMRR